MWDLIILVFALTFVVLFFKRVFNVVYFIAAADIFFRLVAFINSYIPIKEVNNILREVPESIPAIIYKYTNGIVSDILMWVLVASYIVFLYYIIQNIFKRDR